jgi:hypothetical protein
MHQTYSELRLTYRVRRQTYPKSRHDLRLFQMALRTTLIDDICPDCNGGLRGNQVRCGFWASCKIRGLFREGPLPEGEGLGLPFAITWTAVPSSTCLHADADSAVVAEIVEGRDVVSPGFGELQDLRQRCILT